MQQQFRLRDTNLVQPRSLPLATKLDLLDLAEGGEYLLKVLFVHVPRQSTNVDLGWLGRGG